MRSTCSPAVCGTKAMMTARVCSVEEDGCLELAAQLVADGQAIVIPTETIFGLTCDAENSDAVAALCAIKGRALDKPSAIFVPTTSAINDYAGIVPGFAEKIIRRFLPGPLTIVVESKRSPWPGVVGDDGKIGIRVSSEPFVCELAARTGRPLLATSANKSGLPDCDSLTVLCEQFGDLIPLILYRNDRPTPLASTVVDLSGSEPILLRAGIIPYERILRII